MADTGELLWAPRAWIGGRWREHPEEKSLYKYGFHPDEESAIVARLGKAG